MAKSFLEKALALESMEDLIKGDFNGLTGSEGFVDKFLSLDERNESLEDISQKVFGEKAKQVQSVKRPFLDDLGKMLQNSQPQIRRRRR